MWFGESSEWPGWDMQHNGNDQTLVPSDTSQQPGELVQSHWSIKQAGTQVTGKQGPEVPSFPTRCTEAALDPLGRGREAVRGTQHLCSAQEQDSRNSKERNREIPTSSNVCITAIAIYTYACVYTGTHIYMKKYEARKQAHFKRNTPFFWHTENSNDNYISLVEAFTNTMSIAWHKCENKASKFWQIATGEIWTRHRGGSSEELPVAGAGQCVMSEIHYLKLLAMMCNC